MNSRTPACGTCTLRLALLTGHHAGRAAAASALPHAPGGLLEETGVSVRGTGRVSTGDSAGKSDTNHDTDHRFISSG